jgi:transcriptional regulator with PAS, ATPase and Fis domain
MTSTGTLRDVTTDEAHVEWGHSNSVQRDFSIVFWSRTGVETRELSVGRRLTVGRSDPADVRLRDKSLSRVHAELRNEGGKVWVRDLESLNGTLLQGKRVEVEAEVHVGDELRLGGVIAQVRGRAPTSSGFGIEPLDQFLSRLEEELVRARALGRVGTLLMLRPADLASSDEPNWCARVRELLRPVDRMAVYGARFALVLLPEVSLQEAKEVVGKLTAGTRSDLVCGAAAYPASAQTYEQLLARVHDSCRLASPAEPLCLAEGEPRSEATGDLDIVIVSPAMQELEGLVRRGASVSAAVLVLGETGVGKELVAASLHRSGPRRHKPFCVVNCAALPPTLAESLLFGHERGAFTGAAQRTKGVFEQADGGTVFLDEVGELSLSTQAALLRVLENKRIVRIGSTHETTVDVRVVAATHRDLEAMVRTKEFRRDLFYRLNTLTLTVPPLRERREEVAPLARLFLSRASRNWSVPATSIDPDALVCLMAYDWPGNVRELRNVIERAVIIGGGSEIRVDHLPDAVRGGRRTVSAVQSVAEPVDGGGGRELEEDQPYRERIKTLEAALIRKALVKSGGSRKDAADALQMPLRTLMSKMKALRIKG